MVIYPGAEPQCDTCSAQREHDGKLVCLVYGRLILTYVPECMSGHDGEEAA